MATRNRCDCGQEWESVDEREQCPRCSAPRFETLQAPAALPPDATRPDRTLDDSSLGSSSRSAGRGPAGNPGSGGGERPTWRSGTMAPVRTPGLPTIPGYEILGELGRGGMGVVYKARQVGLNRLVALKMILATQHAGPRQVQRFRAEAEAVASLHHPNIVQIYEVGEQDGHPFFSLEFVPGGTLAEQLEKKRPLMRASAELVEVLARAMHYAHQHGIVHRDLKPANILMPGGTAPVSPSRGGIPESGVRAVARGPKIADFGLAKNLDSGQQQTQSGMILGTPSYMSPEQACGDVQEIGPATDIYALGAILYELLTGRPPFVGGSSLDIMHRVMREEPAPLRRLQPKTPRDLEIICLKCLHKQANRRYATAEALADDLRAFLDHEPIRARPVSLGERTVRWARRHPAWTGLAAGLLVAAALLISFQIRSIRQARHERAVLREAVRDLLDDAARALEAGQYEQARAGLDALADRLGSPDLPENFRADAARIGREVDGRLAARTTHARFLERRDVALFQAGSGNYRAAADTGRAALALVGLTEQGEWPRPEFYSDAQASDVTRGCLELLLVAAEAEAQPGPGEGPGSGATRVEDGARRGLATLERARLLGTQARAFHLRRAHFLELAGQVGDADAERALAEQCPAETAFDCFLLGQELLARGQTAEALAAFARALRAQPTHFWAWYYQALCHVRLGQMALARASLSAALSHRDDVVWPYLLRGFANGQLQNYAAAEADFDAAVALLARKPDADARYVLLNNRAVVRLGRLSQLPTHFTAQLSGERVQVLALALEDLREATRLKPEQYQSFATLAQASHDQGDRAEALRLLGQALDCAGKQVQGGTVGPDTLALLLRIRARWHEEAGDSTAALADLSAIAGLDLPATARGRALAEAGHLCARGGRYAEAIDRYDQVLVLDPGRLDVRTARAECLLKVKRYADAARAFDDVLASGVPGKANVLAGRALARLRQEPADRDGALADLTLALALQPNNRGVRLQRARLALALGQPRVAVADYDDLLARESSLPLFLGRAQARVQLGQPERAVQDAEAALRLPGATAAELYTAAGVYARAAGCLDDLGRSRTPAEDQARTAYQDQAVELLRCSLAALPAPERAGFWASYPARDRALNAVRASPGFLRLKQEYGEKKTGEPER